MPIYKHNQCYIFMLLEITSILWNVGIPDNVYCFLSLTVKITLFGNSNPNIYEQEVKVIWNRTNTSRLYMFKLCCCYYHYYHPMCYYHYYHWRHYYCYYLFRCYFHYIATAIHCLCHCYCFFCYYHYDHFLSIYYRCSDLNDILATL